MPKRPLPKTRIPRIMKSSRRNLAISVDGNLQSMLHVLDYLSKNPGNAELRKNLQKGRQAAIESMEFMRDNLHPNAHDLRIIETVIDKLKNNFDHQGVLEAYKITCGLKIGKP